ncbi:hypothetical protein ScPMuIL_010507 [Solemya velum]
MSDLMKELCRLLSIKKLSSTPYHPQTNGLVEKFNGTLKTMLKTYAMSESRNWDKHLPYVLFAYREVPNETTGFSPFKLLYGRHIRGPLEILKEEWEEPSDGKTSVVSFILETRDRMRAMRQLVCMNEKVSKKKQKTYYDRKARHRVLERGQKVLLLLPTSKSKLLAQWKGPYEVVERVSPVDYRIRLSNKEHVYHINMLKRWFDRQDPDEKSVDIAKDDVISCLHVISALASGESAVDEEPNEIPSLSMSGKETVDDVTICSDLTREQVGELESLLSEFSDVLSDVPKQTSLITHSVKTTTDIPIHRKPYPIPYALQDKVKKELQQMKELGIIEDSDSPYSAPMVLVKRPEASLRICIDFRELNRVTVFDPRPMPRMDDVLNRLGKAKYLSKIDLTKGYWQVPLDEDAKQKSSFVTPFGQYRFTVMPFGMVCAPATFVRLMAKVLQGYESFTEAFIDDIGVYSDTWNDHIEHLRLVFLALRESNLSAKPSKCSFGFPELVFLAHVVGNMMVKPTLDKLAIVQNFPQPLTKKQVKSFLGFVGFYRKFVQNFATLAIPLTNLTKKSMPNKVIWNETLQQAFESLKLVLLKGPVLKKNIKNSSFLGQMLVTPGLERCYNNHLMMVMTDCDNPEVPRVESEFESELIEAPLSPVEASAGILMDFSDSVIDISLKFHDYTGNTVTPLKGKRHHSVQIQPDMVMSSTQTEEVLISNSRSCHTQTSDRVTSDVGVQVEMPTLTFEDISNSDSKVLFFTGIPDAGTFKCLFNELEKGMIKDNDSGRPKVLRLVDEFLLVLMRLRLGLLLEDLSYRFKISKSTCSLIFNRWIEYLDVNLQCLVKWPSRKNIDDTMPERFRKKYSHCRVIIDCTEIRTETPHSLHNKSLLFSDYKSHMTYKSLIGISPAGIVTFVSDLYAGSTSDKQITKLSGLVDLCEEGDGIMVDKGFLISDYTTPRGIDLIIPPFVRDKKQFSPHEVELTRDIANLRIHVEREMERIKNFRILQAIIPISMASQSSKIWKLCVRLTNLLPPLVLDN